MEQKINRPGRLALFLARSRTQAGKSQEYMALELGVARKTIQNWEKGSSCPSMDQAVEWFHALDVSPLPYLFQYMFPELEYFGKTDDDERIIDSVRLLLAELPMDGVRELLYLLYGDHGSSPRAVLNLVTAHLQTPLKDRVAQAQMILNNYELAEQMGTLNRPAAVQPDVKLLKTAIEEGRRSVINDVDCYHLKGEKVSNE